MCFGLIIKVLEEMSRLLQTGLTRQELKACVNLLQQGNSHEALAVSTDRSFDASVR